MAGTVAASTYLGDCFETDVDTAAGRVRLVIPSDVAPPQVGAACRIQALPGGVSFIS